MNSSDCVNLLMSVDACGVCLWGLWDALSLLESVRLFSAISFEGASAGGPLGS